jgi:hypothetical protein
MSPSTQPVEESLGINVLPGEVSTVAENDNKKLRRKLHQIMSEYQESMQKSEELEKKGFEKVGQAERAEIETHMKRTHDKHDRDFREVRGYAERKRDRYT